MIDTRFVISPPFGNWVAAPNCTRILGSFTWEPRPGLIRHTLRSLRRVEDGWINQIGLRNRGIRNVAFRAKHIYSLAGLNDGEWIDMLNFCPADLRVEVNLGCPNVHDYGIPRDVLTNYCRKFRVIAKLSPMVSPEMVDMVLTAGVTHLHLCNTLPAGKGGVSGRQLHGLVGKLVTEVTERYPHITIIAGGGIYDRAALEMYRRAGARHFSLATIWLSPWRIPTVLNAGRGR